MTAVALTFARDQMTIWLPAGELIAASGIGLVDAEWTEAALSALMPDATAWQAGHPPTARTCHDRTIGTATGWDE
jgi:hypothetical protein